jgi:uncharacterized membrane protein YdbT with pleckstrin-like domain
MASYVLSHLIPEEQIIYETNLHWIIFVSLRAILTLWISPIVERLTSEFAVTNKRIIIKTGFISRRTIEMKFSRIESVEVNQSIFGRVFDYGSITVIGTGGTKELFHKIAKPLEFRNQFQQLI